MPIDGKALKICRILEGVSLTHLAAQLGVSAQYLSQIETNKRRPSGALCRRYFEALGTEHTREGVKAK